MSEEKEGTHSLRSLKRLWPYLRKYRGRMLFGILCVILSNSMKVTVPWVLRLAIDALQAGQKTGYAPYALGILGATLVQAAFLFLMRKVMIGVSRDIEYDLRNDLYSHLQILSPSYYGRMYTGDLMSRVNNDLSAVRMVLGPSIMYSVDTFVTLLFALTMMLNINPQLTLFSLLPLPAVSWMVVRYGRVIHNRFKEVQAQFSRISTTIQENLSGIKVIKAFGREQQEIEDFRQENQTYLQLNKKLVRVWGILYPMVEMLAGLGILVVLWWGGRQVISGQFTLGEFVQFTTYLAMLIWPSIALGWVVNITQRGAASMARLNEIFDEKPQITDPFVPAVSADYRIKGKIQFRNVTFSYHPAQPVLKGLNLTIEPGKTVSIVGATGGGKTSLLQLIPRLYEPTSGEILIDEIPVQDYPLSVLRGDIGFVPQDAFLFSDTLEENISFGMENPDPKTVMEAARIASFEKEILSFPLQYKTVIGERGITLSGGQKQRATIARALGRNPSILILDDSFSNVDTHTEEQILQGLREFRKNRTCILVSHRISTVQDSDWIYVLEDGQILEQGQHQDLLRQKAIYFDLYQKQLIEEELKIKKVG